MDIIYSITGSDVSVAQCTIRFCIVQFMYTNIIRNFDIHLFYFLFIVSMEMFKSCANKQRLASVIHFLLSIIESSKANSPNNKYRIYFENFRKWCVSFGLQYSQTTSTTISWYIGGLIFSKELVCQFWRISIIQLNDILIKL